MGAATGRWPEALGPLCKASEGWPTKPAHWLAILCRAGPGAGRWRWFWFCADVRMAQQLAHAVEVHSGFQQMGGEAMAQQVDAASLGDAGGLTCGVVVALAHADVQGTCGVFAGGEQPICATCTKAARAPVLAQLHQQRVKPPASPSEAAFTCCAMASPPICWKPEWASTA